MKKLSFVVLIFAALCRDAATAQALAGGSNSPMAPPPMPSAIVRTNLPPGYVRPTNVVPLPVGPLINRLTLTYTNPPASAWREIMETSDDNGCTWKHISMSQVVASNLVFVVTNPPPVRWYLLTYAPVWPQANLLGTQEGTNGTLTSQATNSP
jgi:hypothetical protein